MSKEIDHKDRAHSEIGASSASRWLGCPASVSLSRGIEEKSSDFAAEGTAAHELSEACLNELKPASEFVGQDFNGFEVTKEMADFVQVYVDAMEVYTNEDSGYDTFVEQRFSMEPIHKDMFGSNDFCAFGIENHEMVIADFKYGAGINVSAKENIQMIIYALGAYYEFDHIYDFETVKMVISQPRIEGGEYDEWSISIDELLAYEKMLKAGVKEVYSKDPRIESGDHCKFCKAKATCPELKAQAEITTQLAFDEAPIDKPSLPDVATLDANTIANVMKHQKLITDWMSAVKAHAKDMMEKGHKVEGFKLVAGKSSRKMTSEKEFALAFDDFYDIYAPKKLKGIGVLEKEIGKSEIAPYFTHFEGAPVIAKESDKRKEIKIQTIDDAFSKADSLDYSETEF